MSNRTWSYSQARVPRFSRSLQNLGHNVFTSMSVGKLYPVDWVEVLPGDDFKFRSLNVSRLTSTFVRPVMDNLYLDVYHYYLPLRILYDQTERVFGNPNPSAYTETDFKLFPKIDSGVQIEEGTVGDYLGLPTKTPLPRVSILPFRAFALIYEWDFRNENTIDEMFVQRGDYVSSEKPNADAWAPNNYTGQLPKVSKFKDYFTAALPAPQRGVEVKLPLGDFAPVVTYSQDLLTGAYPALNFRNETNGSVPTGAFALVGSSGINKFSLGQGSSSQATPGGGLYPSNLGADLSSATAISVNDFRLAVAYQKMLERDAIFGGRYNEFLRGHFGEEIGDSTLQRPQFLGGGRTPMNVIQVAQTSAPAVQEQSEDTPLGTLSAYAWSNGHSRFSRHFKEHGILMTVACLRYRHTYQQGVSKKWLREAREDFFDPLFATVGMQPILKTELFASTNDEEIFGYREAWMEYRRIPNSVSGQMRSNSTNTFDVYHFADNYKDAPTLSQAFTDENAEFFDRTLSKATDTADSFIFDFGFDIKAVRKMPVDSQPGLVDHH